MTSLNEACGVFGIYSPSSVAVNQACFKGLYALQHRGQEGCGIAFNCDGVLSVTKDVGLVADVFAYPPELPVGTTTMAIAHTRYGTSGERSPENVQPLIFHHMLGSLALAHNGNLTNDTQLRRTLELKGSLFHSSSDTEVFAHILTSHRLVCQSLEDALSKTMDEVEGAYSLLVMNEDSLIAVRDPHGFRPLCLGKLEDGYVFASESCALDAVGAQFLRDIEPGEICIIDGKDGTIHSNTSHCKSVATSLCVFELIYFARPDSVIDTISVHEARIRSGAFLALEHPSQADVVIGVPDSGIDAAIGYSRQSGIPYGIGFIKNKYIGRTFIQPEQGERESTVRIKLNPISSTVRGKRVVLIDDSIVRGTTSKRIVRLLREAGAKEVHLRSSAPPFLFPCYYGTDIDSKKDLFACNHDHQSMETILGVDSLGFLTTDQVIKLSDHPGIGFCRACFTGEYPCPKEA
ncbi:amidophosphoribosyltransferase [Sphaerochaeta halotolerans]|jgi:amidophosphoribosyltransferase|uniref:Amidophosphoribosyltransferase n=1 Tax=Sphaerochaeta halotolerans TaxID=2293840 RepID=A0A372MJH9_9SPIR|nr:amidophosphoribosyltransferase [Sphaerochaeta halotolerans]MBG0767168.1 amidophosphoribosyltransferase [Spirochaetaceae bacterium]MXI85349.1 amidophosphoribosyltransferase [Sphaerochaeta halotolerans]RFU95894.1 amidophosphoribosyltransferase [Sphaerochaeta halotolerans]